MVGRAAESGTGARSCRAFQAMLRVGILFCRGGGQTMILQLGKWRDPIWINDLHNDLTSVSPISQQAV